MNGLLLERLAIRLDNGEMRPDFRLRAVDVGGSGLQARPTTVEASDFASSWIRCSAAPRLPHGQPVSGNRSGHFIAQD